MSEISKPNASQSRGTVVILEDSFPIRNILRFVLVKNNYKVLDFSNGETAWEYLKINEIEDLKLILSDIMMPKLNGIDFVKKLRDEKKLMDIPIIFLTANADRDVVLEAKKLRITGYLVKPITTIRLIELLKKLFPTETFKDVSLDT